MAAAATQLTLKDQFGRIKFRRRGFALILLETTDLELGDTTAQKYVDAVRLEMAQVQIDDPSDLQIEIGFRDELSDPLFFTVAQDLPAGFEFINTRLTAKFFRIRITAFSNTAFFIFSTLEFHGAKAGARR